MNRSTNHNPTSDSQAQGLMPLDSPAAEPLPATGVFRLEAMAPGNTNAEQSMAAGATPRKRKVSTQVIALGILLAVGGGMIYGMRLLGIGPLTTLAKTVLPDYDLTKPSSHGADHKRILQDLAVDTSERQVPVDEVQKNPFKMGETVAAPLPPGADPTAASRAAAERAKRDADQKRARVQASLSTLKVNGIIGGVSPVARISGEAVRVGDTVGDDFRVKAIHGRSVELEQDGQVYELHMDDDLMNSNRPRKH
ncbi:MAG TPA: hypothetical protein PKE29_04905 [Phycisphaerales bacterium]|nr:hypothetical protein [Phycisphaerales bacterium]